MNSKCKQVAQKAETESQVNCQKRKSVNDFEMCFSTEEQINHFEKVKRILQVTRLTL